MSRVNVTPTDLESLGIPQRTPHDFGQGGYVRVRRVRAWRFSAWRRSALDFQDEAHWAQSLTGIHRTSDQPRARTRRLTIDRPTPRAPVQRDGSLDQASFAFFAFIAGPTPPFLGCVCLPDQGLARTPRGLFIRPVYFWIIFDATQKASDSKLTG